MYKGYTHSCMHTHTGSCWVDTIYIIILETLNSSASVSQLTLCAHVWIVLWCIAEGLNRKVAEKTNRKTSDKVRKPFSALMGMNEKEGWQLKLGYLRPKSPDEEDYKKAGGEAEGSKGLHREDHSKTIPKDLRSEKSSREEIEPDAVRSMSPQLTQKKSRSAEGKSKAAEVVNMPRGKCWGWLVPVTSCHMQGWRRKANGPKWSTCLVVSAGVDWCQSPTVTCRVGGEKLTGQSGQRASW